jgi:hypothetical protein
VRQRIGGWVSAGLLVATLVLGGVAGAAGEHASWQGPPVSGKVPTRGPAPKHHPVCWKC